MKKDKNYTLFIIENNEAYSFMLKYKLQRYPVYKIISFKSCEECIENMNIKPDIILLDYKLLNICSDEVLNSLKVYSQKVPFILLSSQEETAPILNLIKEGTFEYVLKEGDSTKLANKLIVKIVSILNRKKTVELKTKKMQMILSLILLVTAITTQ